VTRLISEYQYLKNGADSFEERFSQIKTKAYQDYQSALIKLENLL
jgi:hypothetical protein